MNSKLICAKSQGGKAIEKIINNYALRSTGAVRYGL